MNDGVAHFCQRQRELLEQELLSSSADETSHDFCVHQLHVADVSLGLYGRTVITLQQDDGRLLPAHRSTTGDEVEIHSKKDVAVAKTADGTSVTSKHAVSGVISQVTEATISVALFGNNKTTANEDDEMVGAPPLSIVPKSSTEVHKKLVHAVNDLERGDYPAPVERIVQAVFAPSHQTTNSIGIKIERPFNGRLNVSQLEAIAFALESSRPVSLIHGPPGTGKTTTVVELLKQAVHVHRWKVLVTAPSNVAVDTVLAKLVQRNHKRNETRMRVVRLGHPARLQTSILPYSLEALVQASDETAIVADVRRELQAYLSVLNNPVSRQKRTAYREVQLLRKEVREREQKVVQSLLSNAQVVLATCVGAAHKLLREQQFDLVVIDEAAQALEAACWIPILAAKCSKLVLAGDHCQLPPTIKSNDATVQTELGVTMFERLMQLYYANPDTISSMLNTQYRMHATIANWASLAMYHGKLETDDSVASRKLSQLVGVLPSDDVEDCLWDAPMLLIDTAGCDMSESTNAAGSRYNVGEAQLVTQHLSALIKLGVPAEQIAVITPYNGQVEVLRQALLNEHPKLQIKSVDGFQGGEQEVVILSLVRSSTGKGSDSGSIGFLKDDRRLNVAITRAKRHCCVVCDTDTVCQSDFIANLVEWIEVHGEARSAMEVIETGVLSLEASVDTPMKSASHAKAACEDAKRAPGSKAEKEAHDKARRKDLETKIKAFALVATPGESLKLSTELTSHDRKMVHEIAESLGLGHTSEGTEGVDRHIVLSVPQPPLPAKVPLNDTGTDSDRGEDGSIQSTLKPETHLALLDSGNGTSNAFQALEADEEATADDQADITSAEKSPLEADSSQSGDGETTHQLLGALARERAQRRQQSKPVPPTGSKTKKSKPQKLGGADKRPSTNTAADTAEDDLDDMAFLDAQIDRVQNSHGRKLEGKGSYRTVMNGILIAKPAPQEKKRDARAHNALQSQLKQAQESRRAKPKKK